MNKIINIMRHFTKLLLITSLFTLIACDKSATLNDESPKKEDTQIIVTNDEIIAKEEDDIENEFPQEREEIDENTDGNTTSRIDESSSSAEASFSKSLNALKDKSALDIFDEDIVLGNKEANVTFLEIYSPTCPACRYFNEKIYPKLKEKYIDTNELRYVVREFAVYKQDLYAAILMRCKNNNDYYLKFKDIILTQQQNWAMSKKFHELLTNFALLGGISPEEYAACIASNDLNSIIMRNSQLIHKLPSFIGTPAFIINGKMYNGILSFDAIDKALQAELSKYK